MSARKTSGAATASNALRGVIAEMILSPMRAPPLDGDVVVARAVQPLVGAEDELLELALLGHLRRGAGARTARR